MTRDSDPGYVTLGMNPNKSASELQRETSVIHSSLVHIRPTGETCGVGGGVGEDDSGPHQENEGETARATSVIHSSLVHIT